MRPTEVIFRKELSSPGFQEKSESDLASGALGRCISQRTGRKMGTASDSLTENFIERRNETDTEGIKRKKMGFVAPQHHNIV